jgi:hypothetical protein
MRGMLVLESRRNGREAVASEHLVGGQRVGRREQQRDAQAPLYDRRERPLIFVGKRVNIELGRLKNN